MGWWDKVWHDKAQDWVSGWLNEGQVPAGTPLGEIEPDTAYLNIFLRSARIVNVRIGLKRFYGVVHSYMSVPHRSQTAQFNAVTTPSELKNVDSSNLDRVVQTRYRLVGPVPYAGGDVDMEMGLFSIAEADLAAPYLSLLESLSKAAGVSFISTALPFAAPILEGVKLLTGSEKDCLEIGISETQPRLQQGYRVVMRAPKNQVSLSELRMDPSDCRLLDKNGRSIADYPYMVFEVRAEARRSDWFEIPELGKAYARVQEAVRENRRRDADAAVDMFQRIAKTCNDLTTGDAELIANKVKSMYGQAAPKAGTREGVETARGGGTPTPARLLPDLKELRLYSD
ncbi:MAG: hypothetical protein WB992_23250 [Bryobacteraceae bacterium]